MATHATATRAGKTRANLIRFAAIVASLFLVSILIMNESRAAFTATTANPDNAFSAATIALTDDDDGNAMFTVTAMVPGDSATGCITVTYTGTADPAEVKLYRNAYSEADGASDGATLDDALTFDIDTVDNCTDRNKTSDVGGGVLSASPMSTYLSYGSGLATGWDPGAAPSGESKSFLLTATFASSANDNLRIGDTVTNLIFTWETQAGS